MAGHTIKYLSEKEKRMRKLLVLLVVLALIITGCSKGDKKKTEEVIKDRQSSAAEKSEDKKSGSRDKNSKKPSEEDTPAEDTEEPEVEETSAKEEEKEAPEDYALSRELYEKYRQICELNIAGSTITYGDSLRELAENPNIILHFLYDQHGVYNAGASATVIILNSDETITEVELDIINPYDHEILKEDMCLRGYNIKDGNFEDGDNLKMVGATGVEGLTGESTHTWIDGVVKSIFSDSEIVRSGKFDEADPQTIDWYMSNTSESKITYYNGANHKGRHEIIVRPDSENLKAQVKTYPSDASAKEPEGRTVEYQIEFFRVMTELQLEGVTLRYGDKLDKLIEAGYSIAFVTPNKNELRDDIEGDQEYEPALLKDGKTTEFRINLITPPEYTTTAECYYIGYTYMRETATSGEEIRPEEIIPWTGVFGIKPSMSIPDITAIVEEELPKLYEGSEVEVVDQRSVKSVQVSSDNLGPVKYARLYFNFMDLLDTGVVMQADVNGRPDAIREFGNILE
jgi:hypothetical protein